MLVKKADVLEGLDPLLVDGVQSAFAELVKNLRTLMAPALLVGKWVTYSGQEFLPSVTSGLPILILFRQC